MEDLHRGFADADRAADPARMAAFLREADGLPEVVAYQEDLRRALSLAPGDVVLDVGCGAGSHAARIARGHAGPVLGLDREAMLDRARAVHGDAVEWIAGDAEDLPLPDASVDAVYAERVLMYLPSAAAAVAEMLRVLRPGGRIAAFELDYASAMIGGPPETADAVLGVLRGGVGDDRAGRRLPDLLAAAGATAVSARPVAIRTTGLVHEMIVEGPARVAVAEGRLPAAPVREWLADQARPGALTSVFLGVLATGRRP